MIRWVWLFGFVLGLQAQTPPLTVVSAASYVGSLAPGMLAVAFHPGIAAVGASVSIGGRNVDVVAAAAGSVSFVIPEELSPGAALVSVNGVGSAIVVLNSAAPGLFTANATGSGPPAGQIVQMLADGSRQTLMLSEGAFPRPFDASVESYLVLYATGLRGGTAAVDLDGAPVPVVELKREARGIDVLTIGPLPRASTGRRGEMSLRVRVGDEVSNSVTIAPTLPALGRWGRRSDLIEANSELGVTALDGKIYVLGGYPANRVTVDTVQVYDSATDAWTRTTPLPVAVNHHMSAAVNGKIYVIGGQTDPNVAYVNNVQEYDPATSSWRQRSPMPTQRSAGAAVVIDGKIYVAGGRPPRGADFAVYDPAADSWTTLPNLPTQRNHLAAVAIDGKMYVVGGRFEGGFQSVAADAIEIYDPKTNTWTTGAPMLKPRGGVNAVEAYGCIHVFGGEFATGVHPDHDLYNPFTDTWTKLENMPTPVHGVTGAGFDGGLIYLPGGGTSQGGSSGSRIHQVYRPNQVCR